MVQIQVVQGVDLVDFLPLLVLLLLRPIQCIYTHLLLDSYEELVVLIR